MDASSVLKSFDTFPGSKIIQADYSTARWLKSRKAVRVVKPLKIPAVRRTRLKRMFRFLDADGSGTINKAEIERGLQIIENSGLSYPIDSKGILKKFDEMDEDGSGEVGWDMFLHVMTLDLRDIEYYDYQDESANKSAPNDFAVFANLFEREVMLDQMNSRSSDAMQQYSVFATMFNAQAFAEKEQDEIESEHLKDNTERKKIEETISQRRYQEAKRWLQKESRLLRPREMEEYNTKIKTISSRYDGIDTRLLSTIQTLAPRTVEKVPPGRLRSAKKNITPLLKKGLNKFPTLSDLPLDKIERKRLKHRVDEKNRPRPSTTGSVSGSRVTAYSKHYAQPRGAYPINSNPLIIRSGGRMVSAKKKDLDTKAKRRQESNTRTKMKKGTASNPEIGEVGFQMIRGSTKIYR